MVDTARMSARALEKHLRDSAARAVAAGTGAVRAPIARFARAIETGSVAALRVAYPGMTSKQQDTWDRQIFSKAEQISTRVEFGAIHVSGDTAEVDFTVMMNMLIKDTRLPITSPYRQHATLVRTGRAWQIAALR